MFAKEHSLFWSLAGGSFRHCCVHPRKSQCVDQPHGGRRQSGSIKQFHDETNHDIIDRYFSANIALRCTFTCWDLDLLSLHQHKCHWQKIGFGFSCYPSHQANVSWEVIMFQLPLGQLAKLLGTLVVDELHLVGDASRGYLLEIFLSKAWCDVAKKCHFDSLSFRTLVNSVCD